MKRLTVHLANVQKLNVNGKSRLFNTRSFLLKTGSEKEINEILSSVGQFTKHYLSNITV